MCLGDSIARHVTLMASVIHRALFARFNVDTHLAAFGHDHVHHPKKNPLQGGGPRKLTKREIQVLFYQFFAMKPTEHKVRGVPLRALVSDELFLRNPRVSQSSRGGIYLVALHLDPETMPFTPWNRQQEVAGAFNHSHKGKVYPLAVRALTFVILLYEGLRLFGVR